MKNNKVYIPILYGSMSDLFSDVGNVATKNPNLKIEPWMDSECKWKMDCKLPFIDAIDNRHTDTHLQNDTNTYTDTHKNAHTHSQTYMLRMSQKSMSK